MTFSKKWIITGAVAGVLAVEPARAGDAEASSRSDAARHEAGAASVRAAPTPNDGGGSGEFGPARSDDRPTAKGRAARAAVPSDRDAGSDDAEEIAKGNTRGRG